MIRRLPGRVIALVGTAAVACLVASLGAAGGLAQASGPRSPADSPLNVSKYLPPVHVTAAGKGNLGIANGSTATIQCKIPRYRNDTTFGVEYQSTRVVRAEDVSGEKRIDEVTCQGKTINGLGVTPGADGEDVDYLTDGTFKRSGYIYLHADLRPEFANVCRSTEPSRDTVPWATTPQGFCGGDFVGGSPPFNRKAGLSLWRQRGMGANYIVETAVGTFDGYNAHPGVHFNCIVFHRGAGECYSQQSQVGKPANTIGGPLYIDVHLGQSVNPAYLLVRGWCEKSDGNCMPHS